VGYFGGAYEVTGNDVKKYYREAPRSEAERAPSAGRLFYATRMDYNIFLRQAQDIA